jgi:hypothetical protein
MSSDHRRFFKPISAAASQPQEQIVFFVDVPGNRKNSSSATCSMVVTCAVIARLPLRRQKLQQ